MRVTSNSLSKLKYLKANNNEIKTVKIDSSNIIEIDLSNNKLNYHNFVLNKEHIKGIRITKLNLANNQIGGSSNGEPGTRAYLISFTNQEKDNETAPAQSVIVDFLPKLKEINLANNWIRSGYISLSAYNGGDWTSDQRRGLNQRTDFIICSNELEKVDISGNYLGQNTHIYKGNIDLFNDGGWSNALKYKYYKDENKYRNGITITTNNVKPTWYSFQWHYGGGFATGLVTPSLNSSHDDTYHNRGYEGSDSKWVDYSKRYNHRKN